MASGVQGDSSGGEVAGVEAAECVRQKYLRQENSAYYRWRFFIAVSTKNRSGLMSRAHVFRISIEHLFN
ncbi:MAG: hypothetical protein PT944_03855 [Actinomycetaceae bacterium]|nr:hypothetical protein [Arcanobacterium sp.]MDD7687038.1 hypothetical protein [Actinomycetaceae bacterium]MDY5273305.1 hypothetical protein [Arcanobacterium sp.]